MRKLVGAMVLVAGMGWVGCEQTTVSGYLSVTDSAGIVVATNLPGSVEAAERWVIAAEPAPEIGAGASPEVPLFRVSDVSPLPDGGVAVGTETPPQALVFGPDGSLTASLGRAGGGPGEFARVASVVAMAGDSLAVWDPDRRRIAVFTRGGEFARSVDLSEVAPVGVMAAPSTRTEAAWTYLLPGPTDGERDFVLFAVGAFGPGLGPRRPAAPSYRVSATGERRATYGPFPGYESYNSEQTGVVPYPFGAETYAAVSGAALVVGTAESSELRYYGPDGALRRIVRWPEPDRTVEGPFVEQWEASFEDWVETMPPRARDPIRDRFDHVPYPEQFPAYAGVVPGAGDRIWVGDYPGHLLIPTTPIDHRVPARAWRVFDPNGRLIAMVETPAGFQPHAVVSESSGTRVWGVYRDELDVETVRAYDIIAP